MASMQFLIKKGRAIKPAPKWRPTLGGFHAATLADDASSVPDEQPANPSVKNWEGMSPGVRVT